MDVNGARFVLVNNRIGTNTILTNMVKRPNVKHRIVNALNKLGQPTWWQKYSIDYFKQRREQIGEYAFQKEFMNNPQVQGEIFKDEQIQFAPIPKLTEFDCIVGHWDVAYAGTSTGDYNAITIWGLKGTMFYHIKAFVRQCKMYEAIKWMIDYDASTPSNVKIQWRFESQFWNDALKMTLEQVRKDTGKDFNLIQCERPVKNKFDRIVSLQPYFQNMRVYFNEKEKYNIDMQTGVSQLKAIEPGYKSHDDAPDAYEGAITYLSRHIASNNELPLLGKRNGGSSAW